MIQQKIGLGTDKMHWPHTKYVIMFIVTVIVIVTVLRVFYV